MVFYIISRLFLDLVSLKKVNSNGILVYSVLS